MRRSYFRRPVKRVPQTRVNEYIRVPEVRLIDETGKQVGIVPTFQALSLARDRGLDLVEIAPNVKPPVAKIIDFDKYRYQKAKEEQQQKAKQKKTEVKGIRIGLRTDDHDIDVRKKQAEKFLTQGNKVRIEIILKGREKAHQEYAKEVLNTFITQIEVANKIEQEIKRFPSGFNVIIAPQ